VAGRTCSLGGNPAAAATDGQLTDVTTANPKTNPKLDANPRSTGPKGPSPHPLPTTTGVLVATIRLHPAT
jgi:hypothetical protein